MTVEARFVKPSLAPLDRLEKTTTLYLEQHPNDARAWYVLGRIHYLSFFNTSLKIPYLGKITEPPKIPPFWRDTQSIKDAEYQSEAVRQVLLNHGHDALSQVPDADARLFWIDVDLQIRSLKKHHWKAPAPTPEQLVQSLVSAEIAFLKAARLDSEKGLYTLGLASLLEQAESRKDLVLLNHGVDLSLRRIMELYFQSFEASRDSIESILKKPISGIKSLVPFEAGNGFLRMCKMLGEVENDRVKLVSQTIKKLERLPPSREVTPIIFGRRPGMLVDELIDTSNNVDFDLDGNGTVEAWSWVRPHTAILTWDPLGSGKITNGTQLFGSYTFQIPFDNGYAALASLDNDQNQMLTLEEMNGIRVWIERIPNGKVDEHEMHDLRDLGVDSISTVFQLDEKGVPFSSHGLRFNDGTFLPTWDVSFSTSELEIQENSPTNKNP